MIVSVTPELPKDVERDLRERFGDLGQVAKEAFVVQSYRENSLSVGQIARVPQMGVIETQAWLGERGAPIDHSLQNVEEDRETLDKIFEETRR